MAFDDGECVGASGRPTVQTIKAEQRTGQYVGICICKAQIPMMRYILKLVHLMQLTTKLFTVCVHFHNTNSNRSSSTSDTALDG